MQRLLDICLKVTNKMMTLLLLYVLPILSILAFGFIKWKLSYWKRRGVYYIAPEFFFGNTGPATKRKTPKNEIFKNFYLHFKSKNVPFGGVYDTLSPMIIPTDLKLIKNILQSNFGHFMNHDEYVNVENDPLTGHLFNLKDQQWRNTRTKLTPTFSTGNLKMMFETMAESTTGLQNMLNIHASVNSPVEIKNILQLFATDIIASVVFGLDIKCMENPDAEFCKKFNKFVDPLHQSIVKTIISQIIPHWILAKTGFRMTDPEIEIFSRNVVKDVVEYREKNNVFRKDFMNLLIQIKNSGIPNEAQEEVKGKEDARAKTEHKILTLDELVAQSVSFYITGFETTSTTTSFALLELAQNNDIQKKLREEVERVLKRYNGKITYDAMAEMEYLDQVVEESLRKHPPAPLITRVCNKDYKIPDSDLVIEAGTTVGIPTQGLHWDPDYFSEPEKFNPERFNKENKTKIPSYSYLPFGEGPRSCIGQRFGKLQCKVGICAVLQKFKVTLNEKTQLPIKYKPSTIPLIEGGIWLNLVKLEC